MNWRHHHGQCTSSAPLEGDQSGEELGWKTATEKHVREIIHIESH
jgi:hypothetical protein